LFNDSSEIYIKVKAKKLSARGDLDLDGFRVNWMNAMFNVTDTFNGLMEDMISKFPQKAEGARIPKAYFTEHCQMLPPP